MNHISHNSVTTLKDFDRARQDMLSAFIQLVREGRSSDDLNEVVDDTSSAMRQLIALGC
jgi:hypothetical protein